MGGGGPEALVEVSVWNESDPWLTPEQQSSPRDTPRLQYLPEHKTPPDVSHLPEQKTPPDVSHLPEHKTPPGKQSSPRAYTSPRAAATSQEMTRNKNTEPVQDFHHMTNFVNTNSPTTR